MVWGGKFCLNRVAGGRKKKSFPLSQGTPKFSQPRRKKWSEEGNSKRREGRCVGCCHVPNQPCADSRERERREESEIKCRWGICFVFLCSARRVATPCCHATMMLHEPAVKSVSSTHREEGKKSACARRAFSKEVCEKKEGFLMPSGACVPGVLTMAWQERSKSQQSLEERERG